MTKHLSPENVQAADAYLQAIFITALDAIITIDERGRVESLNPAAEKLFGYESEEVIGNNVNMLMPSPYHREHDGYLRNYLETGKARIIGIGREVEGLTKNGVKFPLRLAVSEAWLEGKRIFIGTLHDMSDVKAAEAKIKKFNEELEQKVVLRTEELGEAINRLLETNQRLQSEIEERQAVEEALRQREVELKEAFESEKKANELKSRFVSLASHEFRTPLAAILSSADLLEAYATTEQQDRRLRHLHRIKTAVSGLTSILNDFLSLSKLEENKVQAHPVLFYLKAFCEEVTDEIKGLLKPGQTIRQDHRLNEGEEIFLDKKILKNILHNLLSNAIKYSEPGKPIDCRIELTASRLTLEIADQGIGIPEEEQEFLFTRFFRAHNVENIQGTGLGLHIVQRYLDLLGGEIQCQSKQGKGTVFTVTIPLNG